MSLTLHFHPLSSYCQKVLIALYEAGTPFAPVVVNFGDPDSAAAFRKLWPVGQMPVLKDLGSQLTDIQPYYGVFAQQLQTARPRLPHPKYPKIEEIISTEVQKAFKGDETVQQALDAAARQIDPLLAS